MLLPLFSAFTLGIIASLSTCAALLGGIVLSISQRYKSHPAQSGILFNVGRFVSFSLLGLLLGFLGNSFSLSPSIGATLTLVVSVVMLLLGLQMAGVRAFRRFQPPVFKSVAGFVNNDDNHGKQAAALTIGFLTFLLPCGFTLAAEGMALASKNPLSGMLILLAFAVGTAPVLFSISLAGQGIASRPSLSKTAGVLIAGLSIFTAVQSLGVLGLPLPEISIGSSSATNDSAVLSETTGNQQVVKMQVGSSGYTPNSFTVKAGVPVRWEINSDGSYSCANSLVVPSLSISKIIQKGTNVIEFTPTTPGQIRFSCSMGMYRGVFNVV